jgi:hypothetical protein
VDSSLISGELTSFRTTSYKIFHDGSQVEWESAKSGYRNGKMRKKLIDKGEKFPEPKCSLRSKVKIAWDFVNRLLKCKASDSIEY